MFSKLFPFLFQFFSHKLPLNFYDKVKENSKGKTTDEIENNKDIERLQVILRFVRLLFYYIKSKQ